MSKNSKVNIWPPFKRSGTTISQRTSGDGLELDLSAANKLYIDATSTTHADATYGALDLDFATGTVGSRGLYVKTAITADEDGIMGIQSLLTGAVAGMTNDNAAWAFRANIEGDNNDTAQEYIAYGAIFNDNGGTNSGTALGVGGDFEYLIFSDSGDIVFEDYDVKIYAETETGEGNSIYLEGAAAGSGDTNGGNIYAYGGALSGTGANGNFIAAHNGTSAIGKVGIGTTTVPGLLTMGAGRFLESKGADVASANDLTLGEDGNYFDITGTTQINRISPTNWNAGSSFKVQFDGVVTIKDAQATGGGYNIILCDNSTDIITAAGTIVEFLYDGTSFKAWVVFSE